MTYTRNATKLLTLETDALGRVTHSSTHGRTPRVRLVSEPEVPDSEKLA